MSSMYKPQPFTLASPNGALNWRPSSRTIWSRALSCFVVGVAMMVGVVGLAATPAPVFHSCCLENRLFVCIVGQLVITVVKAAIASEHINGRLAGAKCFCLVACCS